MKTELKGCYIDGYDFASKVIESYTYRSKMTVLISLLGIRTVDVELEELITMSCNVSSSCRFTLPMLLDGTEEDKKTAIKQFIAGYIKGKNMEEKHNVNNSKKNGE